MSVHGTEIQDLELRLEAVDHIVELVDAMVRHLTSREDLLSRQFAAAALMRCRILLIGMKRLTSEGLSDAAGVALRPLFETFVNGLYVLLAGQQALHNLAAGAFTGYIEDKGPYLAVRGQRSETDQGWGRVITAGGLVGMLASHVFERFGIGNQRINELANSLRPSPEETNEAIARARTSRQTEPLTNS